MAHDQDNKIMNFGFNLASPVKVKIELNPFFEPNMTYVPETSICSPQSKSP